MTQLAFGRMPLTDRPQWVLWRNGFKEKEPYQVNDVLAKSNDPSTWNTFTAVVNRFKRGGYLGVGYVFSADDPYCGIDLDACRDPETGFIRPWAVEIINQFATYAEVSPSQSGVKLFCIGKSPFDKGRKKIVDGPAINGKSPGIEVYDHGRYFAMTGWKLDGVADEPIECQARIDELCKRVWGEVASRDYRVMSTQQGNTVTLPTSDRLERARCYVAKLPPAISGSHGHDAAYKVACKLVLGFALSPDEAYSVFTEYNARCVPPWSEREIWHKLSDADKEPGERGYLLLSVIGSASRTMRRSIAGPRIPREGNAHLLGLKPKLIHCGEGTA